MRLAQQHYPASAPGQALLDTTEKDTHQLPRVLSPGGQSGQIFKHYTQDMGFYLGTKADLVAGQEVAGAVSWMGEDLELLRA